LVKSTNDYVITDPTNDSSVVNIKKEQLEGTTIEFDRSLNNYREYNCSINSYDFYIEDIPQSIALSSFPYNSTNYSKTSDKQMRALCIIIVFIFMFSYSYLSYKGRFMKNSSELWPDLNERVASQKMKSGRYSLYLP